MVNGHRYDSDRNGYSYLRPVKKKQNIFARFEEKLQAFKMSFFFVSAIAAFFMIGVIVGEMGESHKGQAKYFKEQAAKTDSLIRVQVSFQELYRVQRAADRRLYESYFLQLSNTDSVIVSRLFK